MQNGNKHKILIVDDESICIDSVEIMLIGTDYDVLTASSGTEGVKKIQDNPDLSLILLDIMMDDINGIEVLSIIKADDRLKNIPVVLQTGCYGNSLVNEALALGAVSCLYKPFKRETLIDVIAKNCQLVQCEEYRNKKGS